MQGGFPFLLPNLVGLVDEVLAELVARTFLATGRVAALTWLPRDQPPSATLFRLCRITVIEFLRRLCCLFQIFAHFKRSSFLSAHATHELAAQWRRLAWDHTGKRRSLTQLRPCLSSQSPQNTKKT